jgi:hypothetical protein
VPTPRTLGSLPPVPHAVDVKHMDKFQTTFKKQKFGRKDPAMSKDNEKYRLACKEKPREDSLGTDIKLHSRTSS